MTRSWAAVSATQIGSTHVRDGTPAQDSHQTWAGQGAAVAAVADGHGHHLHFRSDRGAQLATHLAVGLLQSVVNDFEDASVVEDSLRTEIGPALISGWIRGVLDDLRDRPYTVLERDLVEGDSTEDLLRPYGSTVIAMAASPRVLAILQLGDGDAVIVTGDGRVRQPLPVDERLDGTRTTSLCQPDPLDSFRCVALDVEDADLELAFVCTDGFGSSRTDAQGWWIQVGEELLEHARQHDFDWIAGKLPAWLEEPATIGGDDATIAVLGRSGLLAL